MPLHRRIPKRGFSSPVAASWLRIPTGALSRHKPGEVSLATLREAGLASERHLKAKVYLSGEVKESYNLVDVMASSGAIAAIEKAGGSVVAKAAPAEAK